MWPLNMSDGPPPEPSRVPSTFARPCSTCCHCTRRPSSRNVSAISVAMSCSEPVKLGVAIARLAQSTSRRRSILTFKPASNLVEVGRNHLDVFDLTDTSPDPEAVLLEQ